jgi:tetratricopeptide (TPR) repeat protein
MKEANTNVDHAPSSFYTIPFPKNRRFVGRHAVLGELEDKLLTNKTCQKMAVVGLGGIGKTQVALEFAYTVKRTKPEYSIFWIAALSMESMEQACVNIALARGIPQAADTKQDVKELVKQHLSSEAAGRWLLIVDNADEMSVMLGNEQSNGIADYLPESENGLVLFTTRHQEVAVSLAENNVIEIEKLDPPEAVSFLEKSLIRRQLLDNHITTTELLEELAYLPLAIAQATHYLNSNKNITIADYLRLLRNTERDMISLLSQEFRDRTRYKSSANAVAKTWLVSFDQIRAHDPVAADVLAFISCIESKAIPVSILPSMQPEERMERAIGTLCGYSFLVKRGDEDMYDMHRLVHLATGIWVERHGAAAVTAKKAIEHVSTIFPHAQYENQKMMRDFLTHTLQLLKGKLGENGQKRFNLCLKVGQCLDYEGRIRESIIWFEESYQWAKKRLEEEHSDRLVSQHELARAYLEDGQIKKAVELLEYIVAVRERILRRKHPDRLTSQHELARAYLADGQIKKAVELLEYIVAIRERILTEEHHDRLASQHELGSAYLSDGQIKKAVELLEYVVAVKERILTKEHPDRLASQHELGSAYLDDGQIKKAVELLKYTVAVKEKILTEEHRDRLASQHELAGAYLADGQIKKAVELLEYIVTVRERTLTEEHPDRLVSQHELAGTYLADGQIRKAVELLEYVVTVQERSNTEEHPDRLVSQRELARAYHVDGQIKKAVELQEHVVMVMSRSFMMEDPERFRAERHLRFYQLQLTDESQ